MADKTLKNPYRLQTVTFNFPRGKENKLRKKKPEDFRYMKIHIFALRWKDEIRRSSQLLVSVVYLAARIS